MSNYKRLTKRNQEPKTIFCFEGSVEDFRIYKRLQELEDKIEQGTLIELPCKVGDIFYGISGEEVFKYMVLAIKLVRNNKIVLCTVYDIEFVLGKDCFLNREEAEKRLKELQE